MLQDNAFENFLPVFESGVNQPSNGVYKFSFKSIPLFNGVGSVTKTREALIYLTNGKSYMVIFKFFQSAENRRIKA